MQFLYHINAGKAVLDIDGEAYRYIFKVRRLKRGDSLALRNFKDDNIYIYSIDRVDRRSATLSLLEYKNLPIYPKKYLHIGWCVIEPKIIEKSLPSLNEIGVSKITFIYCDRSQKNFKPDIERLERILINSSQQCGRSRLMEIEENKSLDSFIKSYPNSFILDFSSNKLECNQDIESVIVGCEGGFSQRERELFDSSKVIGLKSELILRSESAVCATASRILL